MKCNKKKLAAKIVAMLTMGLFYAMPATYALPTQGTFDNTPAATITTADNVMNIAGKGKNNILNWANFQVGKGETVKFAGNNNYLNLVHGVDISRIYGTISGGNTVYLVNPNGILFGQGTKIDNVGAFVASTRNISSINKEAFLNDPSNTAAVLGTDNTVMDNKDYYPENSPYVPKITVAEMQLTNVPSSATEIILDGPGGVILKNTALLDQTTQITTRQNGGEIGIGSDDGNITLTDAQKAKIALIDGNKAYSYDDSANVLQGYQTIKNMDEFIAMHNGSSSKKYMLVNDIDALNVEDYIPIFGRGTLEGMGHSIANLKIKDSGGSSCGVFANYIGNIRNIGIENIDVDVSGSSINAVGGLVGDFSNGSISNVYVTGKISSTWVKHVGGIIGHTDGNGKVAEIRNSYNDTEIMSSKGSMVAPINIGGIIGCVYRDELQDVVKLFNTYNSGDITFVAKNSNSANMGGIIGAYDYYNMGGIVEGITSTILGCINYGDISGEGTGGYFEPENHWLGGIIGKDPINVYSQKFRYVTIGDSYNLGKIIAGSESPKSGIVSVVGDPQERLSVYQSKVTGELVNSYYIKGDDGVVENHTDFGIGVSEAEMAQVFNKDMIGVHDFSSTHSDVTSGIPDNGEIVTPPVDPNPPIEPPVDPDDDPNDIPVVPKPDVPSIIPPVDPKPDDDPVIIPPVDSDDDIDGKPVKIPSDYDGVITVILDENDSNKKVIFEQKEMIKELEKKDIAFETVEENFASIEKDLFNKIIESLQSAQDNLDRSKTSYESAAFEELKSYINCDTEFDDKVYEVFLEPIREKLIASNIEEYDSEVSVNFVNIISNMIDSGLKNISDKKVRVGGITYTIHYDMSPTLHGLTTVIATVSWKENGEKKSTTMTLTNVGTENGAEALASYANGLAQLNKDVWENAAMELVSFGLDDLVKQPTKVKEKKIVEFCTNLIEAVTDDAVAEQFADNLGGKTKELIISEGKGLVEGIFDSSANGVAKVLKKTLPNGDELVKTINKYQELKREYQKYSNASNANEQLASAYWGISSVINGMISEL